MKKQDTHAKKATRKRGKTRKSEENPQLIDPKKEKTVLAAWENANVFPLATKKTNAADRAASNGDSQHHAPEAETYVLREMPTSVDTLTLDTLGRKICQDIFLKTSLMQGHQVTYVPAWKTYPRWIEESIIAESKSKSPLKLSVLRKRCRARHKQELEIQKQKLHKLGIFADWDASQKTLESRQEARLIALISRLRDSDYLHDLPQLSPWCPKCVAPLNEANLPQMQAHALNGYVKFPFSHGLEEFGVEVSFCVRIQHLWEIAGTVGLGITRDTTYRLTRSGQEYLLFAEPQLEHFCKHLAKEDPQPEPVKEIEASELSQYAVAHPLFPAKDLKIILIPESVDAETTDELASLLKSGVIPLNPAHHQPSYNIAQTLEDINATPIFDETGRFTEEAGQLCGLYLFDAERFIVPQLEKYGYLLKTHNDEIHEPHCPRCKELAVFRPCSKWVFSIAKNRDTAQLVSAQEYWDNYGDTDPEYIGAVRDIVRNLRELRVSTQRQWGMPLPILLCDQCDEPLTDKNTLTAIRNSIQRSFEFWFGLSIEELLPADTRCSNCNSGDFRKETTLIDNHFANLLQTIDNSDFKKPLGGHTSIMFIPQAAIDDTEWAKWLAEISVLSGVLSRSRPIKESQPFKQLKLKTLPKINGEMHIEDAFLNKYPADVIRLVAVASNTKAKQLSYKQLEKFAEDYLTQYQQLHACLEDISSYLSPTLQDLQNAVQTEQGQTDSETFKDESHLTDAAEHDGEAEITGASTDTNLETTEAGETEKTATHNGRSVDSLVITVTAQLLQEIQQAYEVGNFDKIWKMLTNFCQDDLRFYSHTVESCPKKTPHHAQIALSQVTTALLQRLAPLTPFLAEHFYERVSIDCVTRSHSIFQRNWHDLSPPTGKSSQPAAMKKNAAKTEWEGHKRGYEPGT